MKILVEAFDSLPLETTVAGFAIHRNVYLDEVLLKLDKSFEIVRHSENFDWSYRGSGPAQLAIGILANYLPNEYVEPLYQTFKMVFVAQLPNDNFKVKVKLREFVKTMYGYCDGPKPIGHFMEYLPVDMEQIAVGGYAPSFREEPGATDNKVKNVVKIVDLGNGNLALG